MANNMAGSAHTVAPGRLGDGLSTVPGFELLPCSAPTRPARDSSPSPRCSAERTRPAPIVRDRSLQWGPEARRRTKRPRRGLKNFVRPRLTITLIVYPACKLETKFLTYHSTIQGDACIVDLQCPDYIAALDYSSKIAKMITGNLHDIPVSPRSPGMLSGLVRADRSCMHGSVSILIILTLPNISK